MSDPKFRWETSVEEVPIGSEGESHYLLDPDRVFPEHRRLTCHVEWKKGAKIITFRSPYVIRNTTNHAVEMQVIKKSWESGQEVETIAYERSIAAGEAGAVPLHLAFGSVLRFRPRGVSGEYDWNQGQVSWQSMSKTPTVGLVCPSKQNPEDCYRFRAESVQIEENLGDTDLSKMYPSVTLFLCTPMELENLLPCDFEYSLQDNRSNDITQVPFFSFFFFCPAMLDTNATTTTIRGC